MDKLMTNHYGIDHEVTFDVDQLQSKVGDQLCLKGKIRKNIYIYIYIFEVWTMHFVIIFFKHDNVFPSSTGFKILSPKPFNNWLQLSEY